jgi:acetyl/propionyl-CoA carboxylase alpha subunit
MIKPQQKTNQTDAVHSANIVKEIGYPIMIKASDGDTVRDEKNVSPQRLSTLNL